MVPDPPHVLTSNAGWETKKNFDQLQEILSEIKKLGLRSSLFVDTNLENIEFAKKAGADRIEFYTGPYAENYSLNPENAIK